MLHTCSCNHLFAYYPYTVNPVIIIHPVSQSAQVGQTVTFNCVAGAYPSPSYSWSTSDANIFVTSNIMISTTYSSFGNYTCTASSNGVVAISDTAVLTGNCVLCDYKSIVMQCITGTLIRVVF